jgi:hypothetical protein
MVDHERRKKLAFHLRQLSVGLITNDDFEEAIMDDVAEGWLPDQYYRSKQAKSDIEDPIIRPMLELCWGLYDDTRQHKLKKYDQLPEEVLKVITRCILFLHSDKEYEWPYINTSNPLFQFSLQDLVLSLISLGQHYRNKKKEQLVSFEEWQKNGEYDLWPFIRQSDYEEMLTKQPFLAGHKR